MASNSNIAYVFLLHILFLIGVADQQMHSSRTIILGSIISPKTSSHHPISWPSLSGKFEFGFYGYGGGFAIGIWLVGNNTSTVVWTANRDDPSLTSNPTLVFNENGLLLINEPKQEKRITNTTRLASAASMLDSGNFVLYDKDSNIVWQSFQHPTDTILGGQILFSGDELFSSISETNRSRGGFHLKMQNDGNLVIYPANTDDSSIVAYWSSSTYYFNQSVKFDLSLDSSNGLLTIINDTSFKIVSILNLNEGYSINNITNGTIYRATLDANGMFKLYSHTYDENRKHKQSVSVWSAPRYACDVNGFCGLNSFCETLDNQVANCACVPGSDFVNLDRKTLGCLRNYTDEGCVDGKENIGIYSMDTMENITWGDIAYNEAWMSMEQCKNSCLEDCNCGAALFYNNVCMKQKLPLRYVRRKMNQEPTTAFFKVGKNKTKTGDTNPRPEFTSNNTLVKIIVLALGLVIFSCVSVSISCLYIFKIRVLRYKRVRDIKGQFGSTYEELTLRVFSYSELKRATNGFKKELGKGGFGAVYKGTLNKGQKIVAVKKLQKLIEEGEREFRAEMRAIGRTNHKNLVRLLGYCAEDSKRLLVYEYMSNGSLADLLFKEGNRPYWDERLRIALDVAKGIHYLHEECKNPIIHCDLKPGNILMDDFWNAKISDFGLAKLLMPDQTRTFTRIRGTRGYMAPEWEKNTPITVKVDVYSYGIILLEVICCRKNLKVDVGNLEEILLSSWVYQCFADRELDKLVVGEDVDRRTLEKMVKVGLWCIQDEPILRPSMKSVVLMLEGITDIASPPCPSSTSL